MKPNINFFLAIVITVTYFQNQFSLKMLIVVINHMLEF
jgi:hypothetical protein